MKFEKSKLEPVQLNLEGVEYPIKLTFNAMAEFEEKFGLTYAEVLDKITAQDLNAEELQFVLYTLLKNGGVDLTLEDVAQSDFSIDILDALLTTITRSNKIMSVIQDIVDDEKKTTPA